MPDGHFTTPQPQATLPTEDRRLCYDVQVFQWLTPVFGFAVFCALQTWGMILISDADPAQPEYRGIIEGNSGLRWGYLAAGVLWLASWFPQRCRRRVVILAASATLITVMAFAWLAWVQHRYHAFR
jgi:hypothetical protein